MTLTTRIKKWCCFDISNTMITNSSIFILKVILNEKFLFDLWFTFFPLGTVGAAVRTISTGKNGTRVIWCCKLNKIENKYFSYLRKKKQRILLYLWLPSGSKKHRRSIFHTTCAFVFSALVRNSRSSLPRNSPCSSSIDSSAILLQYYVHYRNQSISKTYCPGI